MTIKRPSQPMMNPAPLGPDGHLTDAVLLLAIDGELTSTERASVKDHVRSCWQCRARREHLERTIKEIVDYKHALVAPDMPPPPGGRALFLARLDQLAGQLGTPRSHWYAPGRILRIAGPLFSWSTARIAATALMVAGGLYLVLQRDAPVVSASELLQRAAASESSSFQGIRQPIVIQKLSIDVNGRKIARTIYRDPARKRIVQRVEAGANVDEAVERAFVRSSFNWDDPLSPQAYNQWREAVPQRQESVAKLTGGEVRLDTKADAGPVAEASLTLRSDDYHPIAEDLRLRDNTHIEVAELSYEVVGLSSLNADIFGSVHHPDSPRSIIRAAGPSASQLAVAELEIYAALHRVSADLGEQITVHRAVDGEIEVEGVIDNDARRLQIRDAIAGIPYARAQIESISEATAHRGMDLPPATHATLVESNPPLLDERLKQSFPDATRRAEYVNATMFLCQDASAHAWALNKLADRYTPQNLALLSADDKSKLHGILADHIAALRGDIGHLQRQLAPLLDDGMEASVRNTAAGGPSPASMANTQTQSDDWRIHAHRVHESMEVTSDSVASLLVGATGTEESTSHLQSRLHAALIELQKENEIFEQQTYP